MSELNILGNWLADRRKRTAIKDCLTRLGPMLSERHGPRDSYTAPQIRRAFEGAAINPLYLAYAYVMFMDERQFQKSLDQLQTCDYGALKQEVAELCFEGSTSFSTGDALDLGSAFASGAGTAPVDGFDGGNVDGG